MENNPEQPDELDQPIDTSLPEPGPHPTRRERRQRKKIILLVVGGVVALLLLAGLGYWFFLRDEDTKQPSQATSNKQEQPQPEAPVAVDPTPVIFKSTKFNIEFTHRKDWKLKEAADGEITLTSPEESYTGADGQAKMDVFTLKIRKGVPEAMKTTIESTIATQNSKVIGYTAPTKDQRQYTNVTYVGTRKDVFNFFLVTGSADFKVGRELAFVLPLGEDFYLVAGGYGSGSNNLTFEPATKAAIGGNALTQAISVVESLKIF